MHGRICAVLLIVSSIELSTANYSYEARIVGIFVSKSELPVNLEVITPTLNLAVQQARRRYSHIKFEIVLRNGSNACTANFAGVFAAEEFYTRGVTAFVGPACSLALDPVSRMASYWNIPVYSAGGIDTSFSKKDVFSTLTRMSFSLDRVAKWLILILNEHGWNHVAILANVSELENRLIKDNIVESLRRERNKVFTIKEFDGNASNKDLRAVLKESSEEARVFIVLTGGEQLRHILLEAYDLNMSNGEYAFLSVELIKNRATTGDFSWYRRGDRRNKDARKVYEALMIIAVMVPTSVEYQALVTEISNLVKSDSTGSINENIEYMVNPVVAAFYDCVLIYAWVLNQTLAEGDDPSDGYSMVRRLWNNSFRGGLTGEIFINENGDREADYTLKDMDPETGVMKSVAVYYGISRRYERIPGSNIHWPGNAYGPPPDIPLCGFRGDALHCLPESHSFPIWLIIVFACIGVSVAVVGIFLYRKVMLENQLADQWWKIHWDDVTFPENLVRKSTASLRLSDDGLSHSTKPSSTTISIFQDLALSGLRGGIYRGIKVAVKPLNVKKLVINRALLLDLKQMRDITHENLVRIVGLCIDEPNIALFTELSTRGCLMDLLANDSVKMDWIFRYSIITDIVEGMTFLHGGVFEYHGRLKSTNCMVDGRFTVKLSDYGMRSLYSQIPDDSISNPRDLFWTAPEHLRQKTPNQGSKKGDVYSFGIILQEVISRCGPFELPDAIKIGRSMLEPEEILQRIKQGTTPPFRPEIDHTDCHPGLVEIMRQCWAEQPMERPSFSDIKSKVKRITKGVSSTNFLDTLLQRMELYANNLEQLVEEKTQSLIDEKRKTDELLYQLIPRFIAEELKKGHHIKPESFECVTVFFSDIVGFTALSSESTPMQVVNLLNDLYTCFDATIELFNVYKVETIGDAYMVVSGLPVRIGNDHAREIARMSLALVRALCNFKIRHRPNHKLKLRIGMHSGPCCAGVVGLKMPRYCLFGDTVNTASRMESTGEPMKIHISGQTKAILDLFGTFRITKRGDIEIKGKGIMTTYWLESEKT